MVPPRYKPIPRQPFIGVAPASRVVVVNGNSKADRVIAAANVLVTGTLAAAALWLGYTYHNSEQSDRSDQRQRENRRDEIAAQLQKDTAVARCMQYNLDLSQQGRTDPNPLAK